MQTCSAYFAIAQSQIADSGLTQTGNTDLVQTLDQPRCQQIEVSPMMTERHIRDNRGNDHVAGIEHDRAPAAASTEHWYVVGTAGIEVNFDIRSAARTEHHHASAETIYANTRAIVGARGGDQIVVVSVWGELVTAHVFSR